MDYSDLITPELYILVPILYVMGGFIKNSNIKDYKIPMILGITGIILAILWLFSVNPVTSTRDVLSILFAGITQGVLCAAASVYTNNIYKQLKEKNSECNKDTTDSVG